MNVNNILEYINESEEFEIDILVNMLKDVHKNHKCFKDNKKIVDILNKYNNSNEWKKQITNIIIVPWECYFAEWDLYNFDFENDVYFIKSTDFKNTNISKKNYFNKSGQTEARLLCSITSKLPNCLERNNLFILPVKNGKYVMLKGEPYIYIEDIEDDTEEFKSQVDLNEPMYQYGDSEAVYLDICEFSNLLNHIIGENVRSHNTGRTRCPKFEFIAGGKSVQVEGVQVEIDMLLKGENKIVIIEAKNKGNTKKLLIRQLFYPFKWWRKLYPEKEIICLFFEKRNDLYCFWEYKFTDENDYNSIELVKNKSYRLV